MGEDIAIRNFAKAMIDTYTLTVPHGCRKPNLATAWTYC